MVSRLAAGAHNLRRRVALALYRGQLGPSQEREWRAFSPGRSINRR